MLDLWDLRSLSNAIVKGKTGTIQDYLAQGGNPNADDSRGTTLLHEAAYYRQSAIVDMLVKAGADANAVNAEGRRPLDNVLDDSVKAAVASHVLISMGFILNEPFGCDVHDSRAQIEIVRTLLDAGARVDLTGAGNIRQSATDPPLIQAVRSGQALVVRLLIDHGANVNAMDRHGTTPLHMAIETAQLTVTRLLVDAGAELVPPVTEPGGSLLHFLIQQHDWRETGEDTLAEWVNLLVGAGVDPTSRNTAGKTAAELGKERGLEVRLPGHA